MTRRAKVDGYVGALAVVHELAAQNALDLDDPDMSDEAERQHRALETVESFLAGNDALLERLTVPVAAGEWPPVTFAVADDADMGEVVPALCTCLDLARDNVLEGEGAEARRQAKAVALVGDLVGLHRHEVAEAVVPRPPSPGPS